MDLGVELLNYEQSKKLDVIKADHPADVEACCLEMFKFWLGVDTGASWSKLVAALEKIHHNALAKNVRRDILQGFC